MAEVVPATYALPVVSSATDDGCVSPFAPVRYVEKFSVPVEVLYPCTKPSPVLPGSGLGWIALLVTGSVGAKTPPVTTTCAEPASTAATAILPLPRNVSHCSVNAGVNFARNELMVLPERAGNAVAAVPVTEPFDSEVPAT